MEKSNETLMSHFETELSIKCLCKYAINPQGILEGKFQGIEKFNEYKSAAEQYICNCIQKGRDNVKKTSAGLLWWQNWNNAQYVTAALFVATTYADTLTVTKRTMECLTGPTKPEELITFVKSQVKI